MRCLAFDCSGPGCSVAIVDDREVLVRDRIELPQSEALVPLIRRAMAEAGLAWSAIDLIGVTVGPGRFTSLRVGLAAARGIALAADRPVAGVTTTRALAAGIEAAEPAGRVVIAAIDGGRADLFVQQFDPERRPAGPVLALMPEDAALLVPGRALLVGDGAARLAGSMPHAALSRAPAHPDPVVVAGLARSLHEQGCALPPSPLYLLPPDVTLPKSASGAGTTARQTW